MSLTTRCYIFADDGALKRVPRRILNMLVFGEDAIPEYANTRQRVGTALVRNEENKPAALLDIHGSFWTFDEHGRIDAELRNSLAASLDFMGSKPPDPNGKVVDLTPVLKKRDYEAKHRWEPTKAEFDRVAADLWPGINGAAEDVVFVEGKAPKRPPLTYEAQHALRKIEGMLNDIRSEVDKLGERALKGLAFELRRTATLDEEEGLYASVAAHCDWSRELKARRRTGRGVWYAIIESATQPMGQDYAIAHVVASEKCAGKKAAVEAARRLLAKHADEFSAETTIEAMVMSELEWKPEKDE